MTVPRVLNIPRSRLMLAHHEIAVWHTRLDRFRAYQPCLQGCLNDDERQRANQFRCVHLRSRFIVTHGLLNIILGSYLSVEPEQLRFRRLQNGKPFFAPDQNSFDLQFNLSQSQDAAIYAVARNRAVGVDIESFSDVPFDFRVIARFFTSDEQAQIALLPSALQYQASLQIWTEKEAVAKASGQGIALIASLQLDPLQADWRVCRLGVGSDACAAVAAPIGDWLVNFREWLPGNCG